MSENPHFPTTAAIIKQRKLDKEHFPGKYFATPFSVEPVLSGTVLSGHPLLSGRGHPLLNLNELFLLS